MSIKFNQSPPFVPNSIVRLRHFAWIDLILGIVGAIVIWKNFGFVEIPDEYINKTYFKTNPMGILLGFISLFQGMLVCAFLHVICLIAENMIEIRKNLEKSK
jgi:hypothetical protein